MRYGRLIILVALLIAAPVYGGSLSVPKVPPHVRNMVQPDKFRIPVGNGKHITIRGTGNADMDLDLGGGQLKVNGAILGNYSSANTSLPNQAGNGGRVLTTDGVNPGWSNLSTGDITGLETALDGKADDADLDTRVSKSAPSVIADLNGNNNDVINVKNIVLIGADGTRTMSFTNTIAPPCNLSREGRMYYHYAQSTHPTGSGWQICRNGQWEAAP